ncbi:MAG: HIT family protein [Candidatus Pacearchaeota archaeon]|nr:HIT family protein [Candidatus Pacearchaeota archaeon]
MTLDKEQAEQVRKQLLAQIAKLPKEQQGDLKEQIEEATPSELEEFIKQSQGKGEGGKCIFCEIIAGKIDSVKVYEDNDIVAVMEIMPASKGHILVIPRQHFQFIQEIPEKVLNKLFYFVKVTTPLLTKILDAKAVSIYIPQGVLAGQRIQHFVINLIPRYESDGLVFDWEHKKTDTKNLEEIAEKIRNSTQVEVRKGIAEEQEKYEKQKKVAIESEADKIVKRKGKRMP